MEEELEQQSWDGTDEKEGESEEEEEEEEEEEKEEEPIAGSSNAPPVRQSPRLQRQHQGRSLREYHPYRLQFPPADSRPAPETKPPRTSSPQSLRYTDTAGPSRSMKPDSPECKRSNSPLGRRTALISTSDMRSTAINSKLGSKRKTAV